MRLFFLNARMLTLLCLEAPGRAAPCSGPRLDIRKKQEQLSVTRTVVRGADINGVIFKMPSDSSSRLSLPYAAALL